MAKTCNRGSTIATPGSDRIWPLIVWSRSAWVVPLLVRKSLMSWRAAMIDSPVWRLVQALQTLVTPDGNNVAIGGWSDNVRPLSEREKALIAAATKTMDEAQMKDWVKQAARLPGDELF